MKHKGMTVSFVEEMKHCPICVKDLKIELLDIQRRYLSAYFDWSMDYIRVSWYHGPDREARQRHIDGILSQIQNRSLGLLRKTEILEEYSAQRKSYTWSQ